MKKIQYFLLPLILLFLQSCEQVIEVELPTIDPVIVLNSKVVPDSIFKARITASQPSTEDSDPKPIFNAVVVVERQGQVIDTLHHYFEDEYRGTGIARPVAGQTYTVKASAVGYENVEGQETIPLPVPIASLSWRDSVRSGLNGNPIGEIAIEFDDPSGEDNYYMVFVVFSDTVVFGNDTTIYNAPLTAEVQDPAVTNDFIQSAILLDDATFNGQRKSLKLGVEIGASSSNLSVVLLSCSKNYFLYTRTMSTALEATFNPFSEPVFVHSNMSSKMGIFAGYSQFWRHL